MKPLEFFSVRSESIIARFASIWQFFDGSLLPTQRCARLQIGESITCSAACFTAELDDLYQT
jgi:hypothetical protein